MNHRLEYYFTVNSSGIVSWNPRWERVSQDGNAAAAKERKDDCTATKTGDATEQPQRTETLNTTKWSAYTLGNYYNWLTAQSHCLYWNGMFQHREWVDIIPRGVLRHVQKLNQLQSIPFRSFIHLRGECTWWGVSILGRPQSAGFCA